jgi:hypothetical protein
MVVLGIGIAKEDLLKIAEKGNMRAEDTPASNVIRIHSVDAPRFFEAANDAGYIAEWGQY